jgi:uncharacterized protein (DUF934 family)
MQASIKFIDPHYPEVWHPVEDGVAPQGYQWLTLTQWLAVRDHWPRGLPVGLALPNDADLDLIAADLVRIQLVSLAFPKWTDGRAYSQARLLRQRYGYGAELRATGEALVDMVPLLERTGFSSVALRADQDRLAAERSLRFFAGHYQGDARGREPEHWKVAA